MVYLGVLTMKLPFGLQISRRKTAVGPTDLSAFSNTSTGWIPILRERYAGAWQRGDVVGAADVLSAGPVWACVTLIANDIAKCGIALIEDPGDGIWRTTTNPAYSPVLRKPNHYQNRITFIQSWLISKLTRGNTYALKQRDQRGVVTALYVLDPLRVQPLVAPDGSVYYKLGSDLLAELPPVTVPASEIIHDLYAALYHPLCGIGPLYASGLAATLGLKIRSNSSSFFDNRASLDGILVAPGTISEQTAKKLEDHWNEHYAGPQNAGKIAALGDGLKFEPLTMTARDAQLSDQLKDSALDVCAAFHVPAWLAGYGDEPNYNNGESKYQQYYNQCLQVLIEALELCLDEGLGLDARLGVQVEIQNLLRMDSIAQMTKVTAGVRGGVYTPNEARAQFNLPPLKGGNTVFLQEQDHSLEWLSRRDAMPIAPTAAPTPTEPDDMPDEAAKAWLRVEVEKRMRRAA